VGGAGVLLGAAVVGSVALGAGPAFAASTLFVNGATGTDVSNTTCAQATPCATLDHAVSVASAGDTIEMASGTYPEISNLHIGISLTIVGEGTQAAPVVLDGQDTDNIVEITLSTAVVTMDNLTFSRAGSVFNDAVFNNGTATLGDDTFTGGGRAVFNNGTATLSDATVVANTSGDGTAIFNNGTAMILDSTISGNASTGDAGTIFNNGTLSAVDDTFLSNSAAFFGGVIFNNGTFSATYDTFSANSAGVDGGFAFNNMNVILTDDILDGSSSPHVECFTNNPYTDDGYNLDSGDGVSCGFSAAAHDVVAQDPQLGALADNGGSTQTQAIGPTSPAYGAATCSPTTASDPVVAAAVTTDERGIPRPQGGRCDIGAFEYKAPPVPGYDLVGSDGGVFVFPVGQPTGFFGSLPGLSVHVHNIVGIVPTNDFAGYDLVGSDGGVFVFPVGQSAGFFGSLPGLHVSVGDIVGIVPTADDLGYFLVGADGGVFAFGDAPFADSLPGLGVHVGDIVGIVATADDGGYWLVSSGGAVYALGDAPFFGSLGASSSTPVVGIARTADSAGYWLVGRNGSVFSYGDAAFYGSLPALGVNVANIVSIVPTPTGKGYWLVGSDGGIFAFGDAVSFGSLPGLGVAVNDVVGAVPTLTP